MANEKDGLIKGQNGDWKSEEYDFEHEVSPQEHIVPSDYDPKKHAFTIVASKNGQTAATAHFSHAGQHIVPDQTDVEPGHRRKGLASEIYRQAEHLAGKKIKPSTDQTSDAKALWSQPSRPFGKSESELEKGAREFAAAAAIGAATLAPTNLSTATPAAHIQVKAPKIELHPDLKHISMIESSGGKNKNHEVTHVGLNAGDTAGGATGLMPITVQETLKRNPDLGKKYAHLANASHGEITKEINNNPEMEAEIANHHWARLSHAFKGDRMKMAYAWRNGITAARSAKHEDIVKHPYVQKFLREAAKSKVAMAKSELAKMSRPKITFPGFKKLNTRPDQEVQPIETTRQKEIYGHKVANAELASIKPGTKFRLSGSRTSHTKETGHAAYGKKVTGRFDRNTLGMEHPTSQGPKSAALVGQARSKFEEADDGYQAKLKEHHEKRNAVIEDYNKKAVAWKVKANEILDRPHDPNYNADWNAHVANRPAKPRLPRKPSKPKVETTKLTPEKQKARGQAVDSTIHHEGFHHTMEEMSNKYGPHTAGKVHEKLLSHYDQGTLGAVGDFINKKMGYKTKSPKFTEEILAHSRDILTNPKKRESFKAHVGNEEKFNEHIKNLKQGHQKAYAWAKTAKPEDFYPGLGKSGDLDKMMSLGHSELAEPQSATGGAALVKEKNEKLKKKLKKRKQAKLDKAIADLEDIEALTKGVR